MYTYTTIKHPAHSIPFDELYAGLMAEVANGNINISRRGDLELFNYSNVCTFAKAWNTYTLVARGLILCPSQKKIVATTFPKFFNYGEASANLPNEDFTVLEKMDGCAHEDTILITEDGKKTIKEICESKYKGKVLSFDIDNSEVVFDKIVGHLISGEKKQWYELETEEGQKVKLTGNHKVFLPELNCYRRVDQLNGDEKILLKN